MAAFIGFPTDMIYTYWEFDFYPFVLYKPAVFTGTFFFFFFNNLVNILHACCYGTETMPYVLFCIALLLTLQASPSVC
jgi:hypothetical protein